MVTQYKKPLPKFHSKFAKDFYTGCKQHKLLIQKCQGCGQFRFPPQIACPKCGSINTDWVSVSGKGRIFTFSIITHYEPKALPMSSWPDSEYPINLIIVELTDAGGVHIASNLIECASEDIKVGMQVEAVFEDVTEDISLIKFRPVSQIN